ncbi:MAG: hypothetical protein ACM369_15035 [Acidobacteriota bacterium]
MKKKSSTLAKTYEPDPAFAPVVDAFAGKRDVTRGMMMASYALKVGGKIFAMYGKGRFVVKLPKARVNALVADEVAAPFEPMPGRAMKEWIVVKAGGADWTALANEAYGFVKKTK